METSTRQQDPFQARATLDAPGGPTSFYSLPNLERAGVGQISRLPVSIRLLLESALRNCDGYLVREEDVRNIAAWNKDATTPVEIPFLPARVVLQDFTGVPCVVDLAAMRDGMKDLGGDPKRINPLIPVDLVIDHSVQVDVFGSPEALEKNVEIEFQRNRERYEFLRWGQQAFDNFRVIPPNTGIVHQVNLEYLAQGVFTRDDGSGPVALPDTLVGTDSHTTMINGLGVLGWGVGGIEAEAAMLGQPLYMLLPEVIGVRITGQLPAGATATDLVLRVTEMLRAEGVVGKFVEFFGPGVAGMTLADRATIANMAPEYGATMGYFPMDDETLRYLRATGRSADQVALVETYMKAQGLFRQADDEELEYTKVLTLDLGEIEPALAGPKRPQDRVPLRQMKESFQQALRAPVSQRGFGLDEQAVQRKGVVQDNGQSTEIGHGSVVIAAITSCTNTSNPSVMVGAGLLAKRAVEKGLTVQSYVKTSLAPGSRVVTEYLNRSGLSEPLAQLRFHTVGYGCTTCIGNSGPLPEPVAKAVVDADLVAAAVLSGNRNFEGRVNPLVKANYLASPPLVVAYALAGRVDVDLVNEPLGTDTQGQPVFLRDLWPSREEIQATIDQSMEPEMFIQQYQTAIATNERWNSIEVAGGDLYPWNESSTYIQRPPFLEGITLEPTPPQPIRNARCLVLLGDSVTTDHISPAGAIAKDSPAGRYLMEHGVDPRDFNSYGARRGNDRVMVRGTFANIRIRNQLVPGSEGGVTRHLPDGQQMSIYDAAMLYRQEGVPLIVLAGTEYGTGSSRDWAAKGTMLLGVRAVIAASFERIHRSNLVGMGVLPLQFQNGQTWQSLGLTGEESFDIGSPEQSIQPQGTLTVTATDAQGQSKQFEVLIRIDTPVELDYYNNGGILPAVLRKLAKQA
ncbi:MAG: aconitate hydratase AcnA [Planctomycetota bacterium]|nr:MAG: aconitate hydratase AcnA [Planctomycetota bacterium]